MQLQIEIDDTDARVIEEWLSDQKATERNSPGSLDIKRLAEMLLEDVALSLQRPGSFEDANMIAVLASHGYR